MEGHPAQILEEVTSKRDEEALPREEGGEGYSRHRD